MKKEFITTVLIFSTFITFSQIRTTSNNVFVAKEYSKETALYHSKNFLFKTVLGIDTEIVQFEVTPLAAASSGELTTLLYKCESKQKEGLILGFYGDYWNDAGVLYQGYAFKNFEKKQAIEFLNKIQQAIDDNVKFLNNDNNNNNIYFRYDDIDVLVYVGAMGYTIRLFWNDFDSTWEKMAFDRSKRRFERIIK